MLDKVLFPLVAIGLHAVLLRWLRCDERLAPAERHAAALTFQVLAWTALGFLLGFTGFFRLSFFVNLGAVLLFALWYGTLYMQKQDDGGGDLARLADWWHALKFPAREAAVGGAFAALWFLALGAFMPTVSWDALSYHLGTAIHLVQDGDFRSYPGESFMTSHFARGANLLMALSILVTGTIRHVDTVQWIVLPALVPSVYAAARALGAGRSLSTVGAFLPCTIPVVLYQSALAYADLLMSGWVVVAWAAILGAARFGAPGPGRVLWMFAAAGLALAAKFNAAPLTLLLGVMAVWLWGPRALLAVSGRRLATTLAGFALAASVGLPWAVRNWVGHGSPIYPMILQSDREGLENWEYPMSIARRMAEPDPWYDEPLLVKSWKSWTTVDFESWRRHGVAGLGIYNLSDQELHDSSYGYAGDALFGGNGLLWLVAGLPSLLAMLVLPVVLRRVGRGGAPVKYALGAAAFPLVGYFLVVSSWWPRFSIFVPVMAAAVFVVLVETLRDRWRLVAIVALLCGLGAATFDWTTVIVQNRGWEKVRRNAKKAGERAQWPAFYYTHQPLFPYTPDPSAELEAIRFLMDRARPGQTVSFWTPREGLFTGLFADERAEIRQFLFPSVWPDPFRYSETELMRFIADEDIRLILLSDKVPASFRERLGRNGGRLVLDKGVYTVYELQQPRRPAK